jgi:aromatic ring-opening dioxygenase catalytic subunit (LigB family)
MAEIKRKRRMARERKDAGSWKLDHGNWIMETGSWKLDHGNWIMDARS